MNKLSCESQMFGNSYHPGEDLPHDLAAEQTAYMGGHFGTHLLLLY